MGIFVLSFHIDWHFFIELCDENGVCRITAVIREKPAFCMKLANQIARITMVVSLLLFQTLVLNLTCKCLKISAERKKQNSEKMNSKISMFGV